MGKSNNMVNEIYVNQLGEILKELKNHKTFYDEYRRSSPAYGIFKARDDYLLEILLAMGEKFNTSSPDYTQAVQLLNEVLSYHDTNIPK
ncbi:MULTISPECIES: hypothetical protein [Burkholderia cepacia complex]|uniref:hypothetical protein n=1 Tax=Burkholderia cepacia complex TaxID=87882 RepID=UPI002659BA40|nr:MULTISPECIES: hypothetical protein [Burkholderia cepacia complex]MDO5943384.1 hypothetical protein [Burkholderia cepacia]